MIQVTEKRLELSDCEGTKKVRETSDMVMVLPTESTNDTKIKMHMKLDNKSQQITQITQIIVDKRKSSNETNETNKRNRRIRRNAQKYIMAQVRTRKKFLCLSALSAVRKTNSLLKHKLIINLKNIKV